MLLTVCVCVYTLTTVMYVFLCSSITVQNYTARSNTTVLTAAQPDLAPLTTKINRLVSVTPTEKHKSLDTVFLCVLVVS